MRTSSAAAHKAEVVESGHLVLDCSCRIAKLCWVILIISCHHCNQGAIWNVAQGNHLVTCWHKQEKSMNVPAWGFNPSLRFSEHLCLQPVRCHFSVHTSHRGFYTPDATLHQMSVHAKQECKTPDYADGMIVGWSKVEYNKKSHLLVTEQLMFIYKDWIAERLAQFLTDHTLGLTERQRGSFTLNFMDSKRCKWLTKSCWINLLCILLGFTLHESSAH